MKKVFKFTVFCLIIVFFINSSAYALEEYEADSLDPINQETIGEATEEETEEIEETEVINDNEVGDSVEWTDTSKAEISFQIESSHIQVVLKNVTPSDKRYLQLLVSNSQEELQTAIDELKFDNIRSSNFSQQKDGALLANINNEVAGLNKDIYYVIAEIAGSERKVHTAVKKVDRPALPNYGKRLDIFFVNKNELSVFQTVYSNSSANRKMSYKIGIITDTNILKKFKTNENQAFNELATYAKSNKGIYTGTAYVGKSGQANPITTLNIDSNTYYYCYMVMDDENGKYYPIDDVAIYQGSLEGTIIHFAFASMNIEDSDPVNVDPTVAKEPYPKTGAIILGSLVILLLGSAAIFFKKNMDLKDVK